MIQIKTADEAAYISAVTNEIADIVRNDEGYICFEFNDSHRVSRAHEGYGSEIDLDDGCLMVDLSKYLGHMRYYNNSIRDFSN